MYCIIWVCKGCVVLLSVRLALEEKAACVARSSQAVCDSLVEETLVLELKQLAQEILDDELQRIRKFIKK